ncbi:TPA: PTS beta-glucoside transporter subunit IIBCA [Streptococcus equi subsp. zooepidemicus]|uniref:Beta-glucoside-specific phosphotransferase system (PTS), IIABC component n=2 Tax=Streptococcus equi subsp. zooepidemicus TaxID=40041 RepID=A0ABP2X9N2_STRSZ|nr:beta-glucoside-specific PTS transporter subunit IIABC [Streptococcus equi]KIS17070.1 beta-glucoside-specific phosphotransferase system (PTS), IIABC component [Streptococcus equi subsp. zooepidemicus Sz4is]HEL0121276.1 PTS beta-glucoside transporter subunit IIBCA [Streptococcus equi subsp. zooepidemicus]EQB23382.1 beta-glucoside-specific phosphotransferase system (PTS), IIABC component [Streptococcus equi subsp. zooepidemicus SzS31A1]KIS05744.1 beta-glucoside-specific phosphotransferase syste
MTYQETAKAIFEAVGGEQNIQEVTHCITRLRLVLKDDKQVVDQKIKLIPNVIGVMRQNGQYQIILGNDVNNYYKAFMTLGQFHETDMSSSAGQKQSVIEGLIETIASVITPLIPALLGGGMLKVVGILVPMLGLAGTDSQTVAFINFFGDAAYYFMPIMIAYSAAARFKVTPVLAATVAGILLHPAFVTMVAAGKPMALFGAPVTPASYGASVIPILIMVYLMQYIEREVNRFVPSVMKSFLQPTLIIFISGFLALVVIGPLGVIIGQGLSNSLLAIYHIAPWLALAILGAIMPLVVMTGMHWAFAPIFLAASVATPDVLILPAMLASNLAQGSAAVAVACQSKQKQTRQVALAAGLSALLAGITEPALYGITLKFKKPLYAAMISGGLVGAYIGFVNIASYTFVVPSLIGLPQYISPTSSANFTNALIAAGLTIALTFTLTWFFGIDEEVDQEGSADSDSTPVKSGLSAKQSIYAPMVGTVLPLSEVPDETFSSKLLGEGLAILPNEEYVYAPFDGEVITLFPTKHAIALKNAKGVDVLIHVGIDTVELKGQGFEQLVKAGDAVKQGQPLLRVDLELIGSKGYSLVTPFVVTNSSEQLEIIVNDNKEHITQHDVALVIL